MNHKAINLLRNFSYTLSSNLLSLIISTLVVLIIPKFIGVEEYGYWQLYIFYTGYVGFFHFGWNDGIYLRYGGEHYEKLNKRLFHSQFYMLVMLQALFFVSFILISFVFLDSGNRLFVLQMTSFCMLIVNSRYMLLFLLQATNRIKDYARVTILDRVLYAILIISSLTINFIDFKWMITFDLVGKSLSLIYAMYLCKDIVFSKTFSFYFSFKEMIDNIHVGIKLMFSNFASKLIIGVVRFGVERSWSVSTFGKVSLTLSISGMMMIFINAIGIILFPLLRRSPEEKLPTVYITMRDFLMAILLGILFIYYPLKEILINWLPHYEEGLKYMALLFPMLLFEGKMALLINTYLKTLRKEKMMLTINLIVLTISIIITVITTIIFKNLDLAVLSIVIILAIRSIFSELYLSKILKVSVAKDIILELGLTVLFIFIAWFIDSWYIIIIYFMAYVVYLIIKYKDLTVTYRNIIKILVKS
ncbi:lipopolysaccharide biosynthesis protein [Oceanobacillus halophilus]|uniref:Flippase n=1 Tax=Oceanobacillus halophilus TaxID=930130 RepID=A0A495A433_9BACI|nr:hypothetical protein [Oceanobacillus halophilus]RKQ34277.1 hypothetical protein D8M06_07810 [Oceanobacillus halophilus]